MIDSSVDWLNLYIKETLMLKLDDITEQNKEFMKELRDYSKQNIDTLYNKNTETLEKVVEAT